MRTFLDSTTTPNRFWNIELKGTSYTVTTGKVGSKGRVLTKQFSDEASCLDEHTRQIRKKLKEGFHETTQTSPSPTRLGLEAALAEDPDDLVAHRAYADFLVEQSELRGELIQTQLALENEGLPVPERDRLLVREQTLLAATGDDCLGKDLLALRAHPATGDFLNDVSGWLPSAFTYTIHRGWLTRVVQNAPLNAVLGLGLANSPHARLLRELVICWECYPEMVRPDDPRLVEALRLLQGLKNLRVLALLRPDEKPGFADTQSKPLVFTHRQALIPAGAAVWDLVAALPNLEELYLSCLTSNTARLFSLPLPHLRILQLHLTDDYPLSALAQNPTLKNLTHLSFHPLPNRDGGNPYLAAEHLSALAHSANLLALTHLRFQRSSAGDEGVGALIDTGLLGRLEFLDLAMGTMTDEGAEWLAAADPGQLKVLDVSANAISPAGQQRLLNALAHRRTLRLGNQDNANPPEWLYEGEVE